MSKLANNKSIKKNIGSYAELIDSLPLTNDRIELIRYDGTEILDDIMDFIMIQFPNWQTDLGAWAAEFILSQIQFYEELYSEYGKDKHIECLFYMFTDINEEYNKYVLNYQ